jgi:hypothetical protein
MTVKEFFKMIWDGWMKFSRAVGTFNTKLLLTVFYYVLLMPFGLAMRFLSDPLKMKGSGRKTNWIERETRDKTVEDLMRQA